MLRTKNVVVLLRFWGIWWFLLFFILGGDKARLWSFFGLHVKYLKLAEMLDV